MKELIGAVRSLPFVKKLRMLKWRRHAFYFMLSLYELAVMAKVPALKDTLIKKQMRKFPEHTADILKAVHEVTCDIAVERDVLFCNFAYGFSVAEYFAYGFGVMSQKERLGYISERESVMFGYLVNDLDAMNVLSDKRLTYKKFGQYFGREAVCIPEDGVDAFRAFAAQHGVFVKKDAFGSCGNGTELVTVTDTTKTDELFLMFGKSGALLEAPIKQHGLLGQINPDSVNTVRCVTFLLKDKIIIPYAFLKSGRVGQHIDNIAAGGIFAGVDPDTGVVISDGLDRHGKSYEHHPESLVRFKGLQLPRWDSLRLLCTELARELPDVRFIGWDLAFTENGWVVVEGNALSEVIGFQSTLGCGILDDFCHFASAAGCDMERYTLARRYYGRNR